MASKKSDGNHDRHAIYREAHPGSTPGIPSDVNAKPLRRSTLAHDPLRLAAGGSVMVVAFYKEAAAAA